MKNVKISFVTIGCVVTAILLVNGRTPVAAQKQSVPAVIRANRFEMTDADGNVRVAICSDKFGNTGIFLPNDTAPQAALVVKDNQPQLILLNKNSLASLMVKQDGAGFTISGKDAEVIIGASAESASVFTSLKNSKTSATLSCLSNSQESGVHLTDKQGQDLGFSTDGTRRFK